MESVRDELRRAVRELSDRGLYSSSKWAAEQLVGLSRNIGPPAPSAPASPPSAAELDAADAVLLAQAYLKTREYMRASHVLEEAAGEKARFLRLYALFLAGERQKDDQVLEDSSGLGDAHPAHVDNPQV
jgi:anaphase-promoting complex subunit 8